MPLQGKQSMKPKGRDEVRIQLDKVKDGIPYRKCPQCQKMKPLDDFGLRKMGTPGKHGGDIIANQSFCRECR